MTDWVSVFVISLLVSVKSLFLENYKSVCDSQKPTNNNLENIYNISLQNISNIDCIFSNNQPVSCTSSINKMFHMCLSLSHGYLSD